MSADREAEVLKVAGREISISHPEKVLFPKPKHTKLDLARYFVAVADGALRGAGGRPNMLVRYPDGIESEHFYQKRAPRNRPPWIEVVELRFPSGRGAEEVVPRDAAALVWLANLACLELHPHPVRAEDLDHPDELRVDLDPVPGVEWKQIQDVAAVVRAVLDDFKLVGWPKTSGSRGMHVIVRIERRWNFDEVRRAALALAREVEARAPKLATSKWWKEERHGVFVDYNQNAKDRTVASAYSVRPTPDAQVSAPLAWDEVADCTPADFTLASMPARFAKRGDLHAGIDEHAGSIAGLIELFERQGLGDAPWPPHYRKQAAEPPRVQPSKRKSGQTADSKRTQRSERDSGESADSKSTQRSEGDSAESADGKSAQPAERKSELPERHSAQSSGRKSAPSRRKSIHPLIEIGRARHKDDALAGLARWKERHPEAAAHLEPADVLVDAMRGRYTTWTRIRVNLQHVPEALRPGQEPLDPDEKPGWSQ